MASVVFVCVASVPRAAEINAVTPGDFLVDPPTFEGSHYNNEGFTGSAPDLGALEIGRPVPHFGPRR